ncbi:MAG: FAD-dependent oxidoreductase, partial [Dehalococcoidia bacterium]
MSYDADVIVVGGGPTGLCTGALLAKRGKKVIVFEKSNIVGGRAAGGFTYKGQFLDITPHMPSRAGYMEDLFKEVGKPYPDVFYEWKGAEFYRDGKWVYLMDLIDLKKLRKMIEEIVNTSYEDLAKLDTFPLKEWVAQRCDEEGMHIFWWSQAVGAFAGTKYEDFGTGDLMIFLKEHFERLGGWGGLWGSVKGGGYSQYWKAIREAIVENGGQVITGTPVDEIVIENGQAVGVEIPVGERVTPLQLLETKIVRAPQVVCALPIWDIFKVIAESKLPRWYVEQINGIKHRFGASVPIVCGVDKELEGWPEDWGKWVWPEYTKSGWSIWANYLPGYEGNTGQHQVVFWFMANWYDFPNIFEMDRAETRHQLKALIATFEADIKKLFPDLEKHLLW